MLQAMTYYDLVEMDQLLSENYDEFRGTRNTDRSFHHSIQQGEYSNDSLVTICPEEWALELSDEDDFDPRRSEYMRRALHGIELLVRDGHLPKQDEYTINIWW